MHRSDRTGTSARFPRMPRARARARELCPIPKIRRSRHDVPARRITEAEPREESPGPRGQRRNPPLFMNNVKTYRMTPILKDGGNFYATLRPLGFLEN